MLHKIEVSQIKVIFILLLTLGSAPLAFGQSDSDREMQRANDLMGQSQKSLEAQNFDAALTSALQAKEVIERKYGPDNKVLAVVLANVAVVYDKQGDYRQSIISLQRAFAIADKAWGPTNSTLERITTALAGQYQKAGDYKNAEAAYQRVIADREKKFGTDHLDLVGPLENLAEFYSEIASSTANPKEYYERSLNVFKRSSEILNKSTELDEADKAPNALRLAVAHEQAGEYWAAEPKLERFLRRFEKAGEFATPLVVVFQLALARVATKLGDAAKAADYYERASALLEKVTDWSKYKAPSEHFGSLFFQLAEYHYRKADYSRSELFYKRGIENLAAFPELNSAGISGSMRNLALAYKEKGDYIRAEVLYLRALEIAEQKTGINSYSTASSLGELGNVYLDNGDYEKAEKSFQRGLAIFEKAFGPENLHVSSYLGRLGLVYLSKRDFAKAEPFFRRALAIRERLFGTTHLQVASPLEDLAHLYYEKKDFANALTTYARALEIREQNISASDAPLVPTLNGLALTYQQLGDFARAEALYKRAQVNTEDFYGRLNTKNETLLSNLSVLSLKKGDVPSAIRYATRRIEISEDTLNLILNTGSELQKRAFLDRYFLDTIFALSLHVNAAPSDEEAAKLALTVLLQRKGRALDAMTSQINILRQHAGQEEQKLLEQLAAAESQLAKMQLSTSEDLYRTDGSSYRLEQQIAKLQDDISRRSLNLNIKPQPVTISAVRRAIPPDAALVEFFLFPPIDAKGTKLEEPRYVAYILKHFGDAPFLVDLGPATKIEVELAAFRSALKDPKRSDVKDLARAVDEKVMRPIRKRLGSTQHLLLSPDGSLNLIPFAALIDEHGKYLIETFTFTYLTSGRDLLRLQQETSSQSPTMIVANPLYDLGNMAGNETTGQNAGATNNRRSIDFRALTYPQLPGTEAEARSIGSMLPDARLLMDSQATENSLKQVRSPRMLHIATHGFFFPNQPEEPQEVDGRQLSHLGEQSKRHVKTENPLLRSGLILAGVKQQKSGGSDDGVLTALEVAGLDLYGTKLVVLSACETGLGDVKNGEGVYGLRRALVLAGSESQVMSLWQVSDVATRDLMVDYYGQLTAGAGRSAGLRQAQLDILKREGAGKRSSPNADYSHPYYWAAFLQSGAWWSLNEKLKITPSPQKPVRPKPPIAPVKPLPN